MNYSKWDSLECDDDDAPRGPPRVTRLEGPASITIGGTGAATVAKQPPTKQAPAGKRGALDYSKWDALEIDSDDVSNDEDEDEDDEEDPHARAYMASRARPSQPPAPPAPPPPSGAEKGAKTGAVQGAEKGAVSAPPPAGQESLLAKLTRNGARREAYVWRQTETEVELSVLVPAGTKARQLLVEVRRPQSLATDERARVVVALRGSASPLLEAELAYPVEFPSKEGGGEEGEGEGEPEVDWEVTDCDFDPDGRRLLRLTLLKQVPHGVVLWWTRAMQCEEPADAQAFPDRRRALKPGQQDVWAEAQRMFQDKLAEKMAAEAE